MPIDKRNATAAELLAPRATPSALMISQDFCATIDWFPPRPREVFERPAAPSATGR